MLSALSTIFDPADQIPKPTPLVTDPQSEEPSTMASEFDSESHVVLSNVIQRTHAIIQQQLMFQLGVEPHARPNKSRNDQIYNSEGKQGMVDKVLNAAKTHINKAADMVDRDQMVEQIRGKINLAIYSSLEIVHGQGILNPLTRHEIDSTQRLIHDAISNFEKSDNAALALDFIQAESRIDQDATIQIETNDGDVVTIQFHNTQSRMNSMTSMNGENGQVLIGEQQSSSTTSLGFSVSGNLNNEELEALNELIGGISELAKTFFNGGMHKTFEKLEELHFDSDQLDSLSLQFSKAEFYKVAAAYRSMESLPTTNQGSTMDPRSIPNQDSVMASAGDQQDTSEITNLPANDNLSNPPQTLSFSDVAEFVEKIRRLFSEFQQTQFIAEPQQVFFELFSAMEKQLDYDHASKKGVQHLMDLVLKQHQSETVGHDTDAMSREY